MKMKNSIINKKRTKTEDEKSEGTHGREASHAIVERGGLEAKLGQHHKRKEDARPLHHSLENKGGNDD
jgi:hypothetical protein